MSSKSTDKSDRNKQLQEKCQSVLNALLRDEDNKYCVDCDSKGPRWASWNIGVFLCIRCAGIHRNLGVHISKVKSVNLDTWTPEQVVSLQQMGNSRARAVYEANLPDNHRRPQNDTALETFIRAKYEHKKYIASEWVPPTPPKVNWEKEIDDEIERQRNKRKSASQQQQQQRQAVISSNRVSFGDQQQRVPQLPKPKNPSPKPGRASSATVTAPGATVNTSNSDTLSADLLGLQNNEDSGFGGFLSATVASPAATIAAPLSVTTANGKSETNGPKQSVLSTASATTTTTTTAQSEEESFFNQTAPTEKEKAKLTKDSILALYSSAPAVNNFNSNFAPAATAANTLGLMHGGSPANGGMFMSNPVAASGTTVQGTNMSFPNFGAAAGTAAGATYPSQTHQHHPVGQFMTSNHQHQQPQSANGMGQFKNPASFAGQPAFGVGGHQQFGNLQQFNNSNMVPGQQHMMASSQIPPYQQQAQFAAMNGMPQSFQQQQPQQTFTTMNQQQYQHQQMLNPLSTQSANLFTGSNSNNGMATMQSQFGNMSMLNGQNSTNLWQ